MSSKEIKWVLSLSVALLLSLSLNILLFTNYRKEGPSPESMASSDRSVPETQSNTKLAPGVVMPEERILQLDFGESVVFDFNSESFDLKDYRSKMHPFLSIDAGVDLSQIMGKEMNTLIRLPVIGYESTDNFKKREMSIVSVGLYSGKDTIFYPGCVDETCSYLSHPVSSSGKMLFVMNIRLGEGLGQYITYTLNPFILKDSKGQVLKTWPESGIQLYKHIPPYAQGYISLIAEIPESISPYFELTYIGS